MIKVEVIEGDKRMVHPNVEIVQQLVDKIENLFGDKKFITIDVMTSLVCVLIDTAQRSGLRKATVLNYITNSWEANSED